MAVRQMPDKVTGKESKDLWEERAEKVLVSKRKGFKLSRYK